MNLDAAKQTFIAESTELLQEMEASLLRLESEAGDKDLLDALFRPAHTIKGSAGLFGLDDIVGCTHLVENGLDKRRDGELAYESDLAALLLECGDHIGELVKVAAEGAQKPDAVTLAREKLLMERLRAILGVGGHAREAEAVVLPVNGAQPAAAGGGAQAKTDHWHISLRFGADVLRNGMDPLSFIRYLATLGEIVHIVTLPDALPPLAEMDPESCYLGYEIQFKSQADKETIAGVFDFVREDSVIRILPPHSRLSDYVDLIKSLPEQEARLGELLVASGAITQAELDEGMQIQACAAEIEEVGRAPPYLAQCFRARFQAPGRVWWSRGWSAGTGGRRPAQAGGEENHRTKPRTTRQLDEPSIYGGSDPAAPDFLLAKRGASAPARARYDHGTVGREHPRWRVARMVQIGGPQPPSAWCGDELESARYH